MKVSVIIPFRDRFTHLEILVPRLREVLASIDHEIIVVEQGDEKKFRRANLLNEGARRATGELLVFHDVDYYPNTVNYYDWDNPTDVFLPVKRVTFVYNNLTPKPIDEVPGGYRHFRESVDDNFFGGVEVFRKGAFTKINGFSPDFIGWGFEDADLRERVTAHRLSVARHPSNEFLALDHPDSGPASGDPDFTRNIQKWQSWQSNLSRGLNNCHPVSATRVTIMEELHDVDLWYRVTDFDAPVNTHIVASSFNFEEGEE